MSDTENASVPSKGGSKVKLAVLALAIVGLVVLSQFYDIPGAIRGAMDWIEGQGAAGAVVFVLLYIAACVLMLPGSVLTLGAGAIYGLWIGFALVSAASTLGAGAAFLVGRYVARDWVASKIEGNTKFRAIDEAVAEEGWKIVFLTRLTPVIPFNLLNYGYGATKVSFRHYFFASWIGMMPGTLLYTYIGFIGGSAAEGGGTSGAQWALRIVGLVATVAVTVLVTRMAKRALSRSEVTEGVSE